MSVLHLQARFLEIRLAAGFLAILRYADGRFTICEEAARFLVCTVACALSSHVTVESRACGHGLYPSDFEMDMEITYGTPFQ